MQESSLAMVLVSLNMPQTLTISNSQSSSEESAETLRRIADSLTYERPHRRMLSLSGHVLELSGERFPTIAGYNPEQKPNSLCSTERDPEQRCITKVLYLMNRGERPKEVLFHPE